MADEYWSKRLYWTWLNWTEVMPWMMWDRSGVSTNHPYGGYISSSTNNLDLGGYIFSSHKPQLNIGVWYKQSMNQLTTQWRTMK